jgi:hypothetical protein
MEQPVVAKEEIVPAIKPLTTASSATTTSSSSLTTAITSALSTTTTTNVSLPVTVSDSKVSQSDAIFASAVKVVETKDVTAKSDDVTLAKDGHDRTKLSLKLPPRPEDYDFYWYQDDDGTWRNEYDDQVRITA